MIFLNDDFQQSEIYSISDCKLINFHDSIKLIKGKMTSQQIIQPSDQLKSLPTVGINTIPILWRDQKAKRDMELANETGENYWICEGKLYDLTQFVNIHPGGPRWLQNTRNHDITQLFITHHLNQQKAREILKKYQIRDCSKTIKRFTFQQNGLYRTVKRRILQRYTVKQIQNQEQSMKQTWIIMLTFFLMVTLTAFYESYILAGISGILVMGIFGVMHNFMHHKSNMYSSLVKLTGFSFDDFQIMHCISHHIYVNTQLDFEVTGMEPIAHWLRSKPVNKFYTQLVIQPILAMASVMNVIMNLTVFPLKYWRLPDLDYAYPLLVWLYMYAINKNALISLKLWIFMYIFYSFFFFKVLLCQHRMPQLWTQGNKRIWDFGQHTIASTSDVNPTVTGIPSFVLMAGFNLHTIHHFFPTADHSILPKLNQILIQVCKERNISYNSMGRLECTIKFTQGMTARLPYGSQNKKLE